MKAWPLLLLTLVGCSEATPANRASALKADADRITQEADAAVNQTIEELGPVELWQPNSTTPPAVQGR